MVGFEWRYDVYIFLYQATANGEGDAEKH